MEIKKVIGFLAPALKESDNIPNSSIIGEKIAEGSKLYQIIKDIFDKSSKECDIPIKFIAVDGKQQNPMRDLFLSLNNDFTINNCKEIVKTLSYLTDGKTKDGLLFFAQGVDANNTKLMITRFPAETGITINPNKGKANFSVIDDVFLKNSRKYKAVFYNSSDLFWIGYAVDKQVNVGRGKVKEISDYWIKQFLKSEMKITAKRGTAILAKAIRSTLVTTDDDAVKEELISLSTTIKNANHKNISFNSFFDEMNLSESTKSEVLGKIELDLQNIRFQIDVEEFQSNCSYLVKILDNGAIVIGPAKDFEDIWNKESLTAEDEVTYSTTGKQIKSKFQQRV